MTEQTLWEQLAAPFAFSEIEVKCQTVSKQSDTALASPYFDARAVRNRLNAVLGRENWKPEYRDTPKGVICALSLRINGEWVTKEDGADYTDIAPFKGGISDAFKRAYAASCNDSLYLVDLGWFPCEKNGDRFKCWTKDAMKQMQSKYEIQSGLNKNAPQQAKAREGSKDENMPFGWKPGKMPTDVDLAKEPTVAQRTTFGNLCGDHNIESGTVFKSFLCRKYSITKPDGLGGYSFAIDFLINAPDEIILRVSDECQEALKAKGARATA